MKRLSFKSRPAGPATHLLEVVTPGSSLAGIEATANFLASMATSRPFALEIAGTSDARWLLVRAYDAVTLHQLEQQLIAAYPQAQLRQVDLDRYPSADPLTPRSHEASGVCELALEEPEYLPLRTFGDGAAGDSRPMQSDPVVGIVNALRVPDGRRAVAQLALAPAPRGWAKPHQQLIAQEEARRRMPSLETASWSGIATPIFAFFGIVSLMLGWRWYGDGEWWKIALVAGLGMAGVAAVFLYLRRSGQTLPIDPDQIRAKITPPAYTARLQLAVFGPASASAAEMGAHLRRIAGAYGQFSLSTGNTLGPRKASGSDLRVLAPCSAQRLNIFELAGLWHPPLTGADVPLVERTGFRRSLPMPDVVRTGCRIGVSEHQGHSMAVHLPDELLRRHMLLVAKTRRGKSSLMLRVATHLMRAHDPLLGPPAVLLVDPHRDLAQAALGLVPEERRKDVVYLDLTDTDFPFGLNLLDAGLGWDRDKAVHNTLDIMRRQWENFWGPRMRLVFEFALQTIYEANRALCLASPDGRRRQYTLLDVAPLLIDPMYRRHVLASVQDRKIKEYWANEFEKLDRTTQIASITPVLTKVERFAASMIARRVVGQPASTIDPAAWLRNGSIVIVNTAKGVVGEDTAALIGATLLNLMNVVVSEQASLPEDQRHRIAILVDEFQTMPGAGYEMTLGELNKYGANLVLATQTLSTIDVLDREEGRDLKGNLFGNLDGLFTFNMSAEDATYLVAELGEPFVEQDLLSLPEHTCYARISARGVPQPPFSVVLDPPCQSDPRVAALLAQSSAALYGRPKDDVDDDLMSAMARLEQVRPQWTNPDGAGLPNDGGGRGGKRKRDRRGNGDPRRGPKPQDATQMDLMPEQPDDASSGQRPTDDAGR